MYRIHLVTPGGDTQTFSPDLRIHLHTTGDDVGIVLLAAVESLACNGDISAIHAVTGQSTTVKLWCSCGQRSAIGINKAAAITADPGGVSNNDLRLLPGDLDIAIQLTQVSGVNLVEDHRRLTPCQIGICGHHASDMGRGILMAVVENDPALIHIKLAVEIVGYPTGTR